MGNSDCVLCRHVNHVLIHFEPTSHDPFYSSFKNNTNSQAGFWEVVTRAGRRDPTTAIRIFWVGLFSNFRVRLRP